MTMKHKAPFYMGGGIGTELKEFDLQRFAKVSNPYTSALDGKLEISAEFLSTAPVTGRYNLTVGNISNAGNYGFSDLATAAPTAGALVYIPNSGKDVATEYGLHTMYMTKNIYNYYISYIYINTIRIVTISIDSVNTNLVPRQNQLTSTNHLYDSNAKYIYDKLSTSYGRTIDITITIN